MVWLYIDSDRQSYSLMQEIILSDAQLALHWNQRQLIELSNSLFRPDIHRKLDYTITQQHAQTLLMHFLGQLVINYDTWLYIDSDHPSYFFIMQMYTIRCSAGPALESKTDEPIQSLFRPDV